MEKEPGQYSIIFVIIGIILVTLVAGTTYSAYKRDLDVLRVQEASSFAPTLHSLTRDLNAVQFFMEQNAGATQVLAPAMIHNIELQIAKIRSESDDFSTLPGEGAKVFAEILGLVDAMKSSVISKNYRENLHANKLLPSHRAKLDRFDKYVSFLLVAEVELNEHLRGSIKSGARSSIILSFLTVLLSILGMAHFIRLNTQNEMMATHNKNLAQKADAGNRAKSRLLTMLSHEIRTPMNGVIGLASLSLQQKLPEGQRKLLEQIKGSAMELISFLEDMLDFSNLDAGENELRAEYILTEDIKQSLLERLRSVAKRQGTNVTIEYEPTAPAVVLGDAQRIQQSLFYFLNFIIKNSYQRQINCKSDIYDNIWLWRIDLNMNEQQGEKWQINSLVGKSEADEFITSDTIETTIARGLIDSLDGQLKLIRGQQNRDQYRLLIYIPISRADQFSSIKIGRSGEDASPLILKKMFAGVKFEVIDHSSFGTADFVLCEGKKPAEYQHVADLRKASPKAKFIHIGHSLAPQLYDGIVIPKEEWLIQTAPVRTWSH